LSNFASIFRLTEDFHGEFRLAQSW